MSRIDNRQARSIADDKCESQMCSERTQVAQRALNAWAKSSWLKEDGILGRRTRNALKRFQEEHGLAATGELDRATERALEDFTDEPQQQDQQKQEAHAQSKKNAAQTPRTQTQRELFSVNGVMQSVKAGAIDGAIDGLQERAKSALKQQAAEILDVTQRDLSRQLSGGVRWAESLGILGSDKQTKIAQQNDDIVNLAIEVAHNPQAAFTSMIKTIAEDAIERATTSRNGSNGAINTNDAIYELSKKQVSQFTDMIAGKMVAQVVKTGAYREFMKRARSVARDVVGGYATPLKIAKAGVELQALLGSMAGGSEALKKTNNALYRKLDGTALNGAAEFENLHLLYFVAARYQSHIDLAARAFVATTGLAKAS